MNGDGLITMLDQLALVFSLVILGKAALDDWRTREISDKLWISYLFLSLPYWILRLALLYLDGTSTSTFLILLMVTNLVMAIITALGLGLSGMWGGGDVKGFMVMGLAVSSLPFLLLDPTSLVHEVNSLIPPSFTILANAYFLLFPLPFLILARNLVKRRNESHRFDFPLGTSFLKKIALLFLASPYHLSELKRWHYWHYELMELPMAVRDWLDNQADHFLENGDDEENLKRMEESLEAALNQGMTRWIISFRIGLLDPDVDVVVKKKVLEFAKQQGKPIIWAQRSIPFMVFLFIGLFIATLFGNLLVFVLIGS